MTSMHLHAMPIPQDEPESYETTLSPQEIEKLAKATADATFWVFCRNIFIGAAILGAIRFLF